MPQLALIQAILYLACEGAGGWLHETSIVIDGMLFLSHAAVEAKGNVTCTPVQILNLEVKDNHEEATLGAFLILQLCEMVSDIAILILRGNIFTVWNTKMIWFTLFGTTYGLHISNCFQMKRADDLEDELEEIIQEFELRNSRTLLHTVLFY